MKQNEKGFSVVEAIVILIIIVVLAAAGYFVWQKNRRDSDKKPGSTTARHSQRQGQKQSSETRTSDLYFGWKSATSVMAGFTIKYPADWTYNAIVGKDNVEHITIDGTHMHVTVDSYSGAADTKCPDCSRTLSSTSFTVTNLGPVNLKAVAYKLDNGAGNALILELPDSTYYIPSKHRTNIATTFRGISVLDSESAYQAETASQFSANPDYEIAQEILKSIAY